MLADLQALAGKAPPSLGPVPLWQARKTIIKSRLVGVHKMAQPEIPDMQYTFQIHLRNIYKRLGDVRLVRVNLSNIIVGPAATNRHIWIQDQICEALY